MKRRTAKHGLAGNALGAFARSPCGFDVAESGVGPRGRDAQADQRAGLRGDFESGANDVAIARGLRDDVIGGENGHQRVGRRGPQKMNGGKADGGCGVAADGFGEDVRERRRSATGAGPRRLARRWSPPTTREAGKSGDRRSTVCWIIVCLPDDVQ